MSSLRLLSFMFIIAEFAAPGKCPPLNIFFKALRNKLFREELRGNDANDFQESYFLLLFMIKGRIGVA